MDVHEKTKLLRLNNSLREEVDLLKKSLIESRTALTHSQSIAGSLSEICKDVINAVKNGTQNDEMLRLAEDEVDAVENVDWLSSLYERALERGFNEGYLFAKLSGSNSDSIDNARKKLTAKTSSIWPPSSRKLGLRLTRQKKTEPTRYGLEKKGEDSPLRFDSNGDYVEYADYVDLNFKFDMLKEELSGYRWLLHDPLKKRTSTNHISDGCNNFLRRPRKPGVLKAKIGKNNGERDFFVLYGDGVPACDRALIFHALGASQMRYDHHLQRQSFEPSLLEELKDRGYDLGTFEFSVTKKVDE
jgi:hypothetical protein